MGGGDLNSKKSWHPNTMKNQERVWKAEQVAAEEKKRILELQQERAQERDRQELNELARKNAQATDNVADNRLDWMYNKPDKQHQQEDYLLGKAIDKNFEQSNNTEQNEIPAVARRVVGSSMLSTASDVQVDLARKLREDPLLLVKERERAARAALLNNPVQRKKLAELLRKEQEQKKAQKEKKKHKKKDKDLDNLLAAKLNALSSNKVDLAKLLESDDSSDSDSSEEEKSKKKKKKKKHKNEKSKESKKKSKEKHEKASSRSKHKKSKRDDSEELEESRRRVSSKRKSSVSEDEAEVKAKKHKKNDKRNKHDSSSSDEQTTKYNKSDRKLDDRSRRDSYKKSQDEDRMHNLNKDLDRRYRDKRREQYKDSKTDRSNDRYERSNREADNLKKRKTGLTDEEKAAKLAEMAAAGAEREIQRGRRVAAQLAEKSAEEKYVTSRNPPRNEARALPESLESRIHSNRHYIQRDQRHMNENFARR